MKKGFIQAILVSIFLASTVSPAGAEERPHGESDFNLQELLVHHLMDSPVVEFNVGGHKVYKGEEAFEKDPYRRYIFSDERGEYKWEGGLPLHLTRRVLMMFIASLVLILVLLIAARKISSNPYRVNGVFANLMEVLIQFVRNDIADKNMHHAKAFHPFILTVFFFVLTFNLLGLFPPLGEIAQSIVNLAGGEAAHEGAHGVSVLQAIWPGITVTGDIAVTMTLAIITTLLIWVIGFVYQGPKFLLSCIPHGMPKAIAAPLFFLLFPLELIIGPIAKGFALTIRLLANMTAGHVIILVLIGFIFQFKSYALIPVSVGAAGMIYLLEIFVAFLQAFIFTLLTAIFIGSSMHAH
jgi:F-type H+-transporting ATPase subunit a